ncbi:MAG: hypothetical protein SD837_20085 [Candidatus Electrothrix scaldis]|nr:MAG: hypothetical protein SD837_20085 [Candidatus Electrothrix sp. GW3-3]
MPRSADYTIQGFLYQFNKTILEILKAEPDASVNIEGLIEDIEIVSSKKMTGIQCKYHEAAKKFTQSAIYKPLLQMLKHFSRNPDHNVEYVLFAHFPGTGEECPIIGKQECEDALASKDKKFKDIIGEIPDHVNLDEFLHRFKMEFGPNYDSLVKEVILSLKDNNIPSEEIEALAYPNAIHIIACISILHDPSRRQITKTQFLDQLNDIRTTVISRWTLALSTRKKILDARRKQLKEHLNVNSRCRYFVIDPDNFRDFDTRFVLFLNSYLQKYHYKPTHINPPIFCVCASREDIQNIRSRLYQKNIRTTDGYVGGQFEESHFFREPCSRKINGSSIHREFDLRIIDWERHGAVINKKKCDDLFVFGNLNLDSIETSDVNVEELTSTTIKEIEYVMGISNVCD